MTQKEFNFIIKYIPIVIDIAQSDIKAEGKYVDALLVEDSSVLALMDNNETIEIPTHIILQKLGSINDDYTPLGIFNSLIAIIPQIIKESFEILPVLYNIKLGIDDMPNAVFVENGEICVVLPKRNEVASIKTAYLLDKQVLHNHIKKQKELDAEYKKLMDDYSL